ncbi:MAG: glycosyltransferase [Planctomycetes bacterium]|nr:glycosyltransferase [Planctomycetota bacterium]
MTAARTSLFLFAHQDDEFGVLAAIGDARRAGERVVCAYFTDGSLGGDPAVRDAESRAVLQRLGVELADVHFFGVTHGVRDGRLYESLPQVAELVGKLLDEVPAGSSVHLAAWEGGHHDHDALHAVTVLALQRRGRLADGRQFPLYNAFRRPGPLFRVLSPLAANGPVARRRLGFRERLAQLRVCLSYPSQRTTWLGLFPFVVLHMLWRGTAALQPVSVVRLGERPHAGPLYYEKRGFLTYEALRTALDGWQHGRSDGCPVAPPRPLATRHARRWTAPVRAVATAARRLLLGAAHTAKKLVPLRWQWRAKVAYFTVFAPLLRHTNEYREFQAVRRSMQAALRAPSELPPMPPGSAGRDDVLVFGVVDWAFRMQRPQHLARELARRGHRVFYVAPNPVLVPKPGFSIERVDAALPIHQIRLHAPAMVSIYAGTPPPGVRDALAMGLRALLAHVGVGPNVALVDHPGWVALARLVPRSHLVYDCMDDHHGFATANAALVADEQRLLAEARLVVVSSSALENAMRRARSDVPLAMVRNACDPRHFAGARKQAPTPRPVVGYFGAIAEWFDVRLFRAVAAALPDHDFLLVGADSAGVQQALAGLPNVRFLGELAYADLPAVIAPMDVLFVPFVISRLTLATNPVKAYEALAAGKPVVATPMPELMLPELAPFVRIGADAAACTTALRQAVREAQDPAAVAARLAFAEGQTWASRATALVAAVAAVPEPRFGVVVVAWNGLALTRRCVRSLLEDPAAPPLDVVIVDNASTDGTAAWLDEVEREPSVRVIRNPDNRGFAAACNQGLAAVAAAGAEVLVILNNDLVVTPGWARTFAAHLRRDPSIGLIGPITNNIGNEARIDTTYTDMPGMLREAAARTGGNAGLLFDIPVLAFFCVAMPRDVYLAVGDLDPAFGTGFFEDDDYCQRVRQLGRRIVCAEDVFVHHELSASFGRIDPAEKARLFERNKAYYESKWGRWQPHAERDARTGKRRQAQ